MQHRIFLGMLRRNNIQARRTFPILSRGMLVAALVFCPFTSTFAKCLEPIPPLSRINYNGTLVDLHFAERDDGTVSISLLSYSPRDEAADTQLFAREMDQQLPKASCGESVHRNGIRSYIQDGAWHVETSVTSRKWLCIKTDGFCSKGLKFYACTWTIRSEDIGFQKTLDVWTTVRPTIVTLDGTRPQGNYAVEALASTKLEELRDWEKALIDALRFLGKGVKIVTFNLIDITKNLDFSLPDLPPYRLARENFPSLPNFNPRAC